jgi:glyoxylase-like metal-dependent hydrolase (beta-lactamase superfamily II)
MVGDEKALFFDTGMGISNIRNVVEELTKFPAIVLNSHTHNDHTDFSRQNAKGSSVDAQAEIASGEICGELPQGFDAKSYRTKPWAISRYIHDGDKLELGERTIEIISTPGHTPDSICLYDAVNHLLFTGDTYYLPLSGFTVRRPT